MNEPACGQALVVLTGLPASGKTTVGAKLAKRLGVEFTDVDAVIEQTEGRPIAEIFATQGEVAFRRLELTATLEALRHPVVVALGGGAITNPTIRQALAGYRVVWLCSSIEQSVRRVGAGSSRPLLQGDVAGRLRQLRDERKPWYAEVASTQITTDHRSPAKVAAEIAAWLEQDASTADGKSTQGESVLGQNPCTVNLHN